MEFPAMIAGMSALLIALSLWIAWNAWWKIAKEQTVSQKETAISNTYNDFSPIPNFDWTTTEPIKLRPFKPTYHLTMALQSCSLSDLVVVDRTYLDRIKDRRDLIATRCEDVIGCNPVAKEAVDELYTWVFGDYLPKRFPSMFKLAAGCSRNSVTNEHIDLTPPENPIESLKILGRHIDTEFLVLLPTSSPLSAQSGNKAEKILPTQSPEEPYHLHAFTLCYPSGFNTLSKLGLPLNLIHAPVPGYEEKIGRSMDRFFASIPFGKIVQRSNWAVQTDDIFFHRDSNHIPVPSSEKGGAGKEVGGATAGYEASRAELDEWAKEASTVIPENCRLRCERQTLHRLEKTGALVFGFKTYLYPLEEVREEGLGEEMAKAVEGLGKGSVAGMGVYKRGVIWGTKVCEFLRG